jgi:hypothetical protein
LRPPRAHDYQVVDLKRKGLRAEYVDPVVIDDRHLAHRAAGWRPGLSMQFPVLVVLAG